MIEIGGHTYALDDPAVLLFLGGAFVVVLLVFLCFLSAAFFERASSAAAELDEELSIAWQLRALRKLGEKHKKLVDRSVLSQKYTSLVSRALEAGKLELVADIALEGYALLTNQHSLITMVATHQQERGDETEQWRWLSTILDCHPKNAAASGALGDWYQQNAMLIKASTMFAAAHSFDSAHPQWLAKQAEAHYRAGEFEKGDAAYRELTSTKWAHQLKGQVPRSIQTSLTNPEMLGMFTGETPRNGWTELGFDDSGWEERVVRFQSGDAKADFWEKPIHARHKFEVGRLPRQVNLQTEINGVEIEVYLNGVLLQSVREPKGKSNGSGTSFVKKLSGDSLKLLKEGENVLAFKCRKLTDNPRARVKLLQVFVPLD